ncbi:MAG: hypothetical protein ABEK17_03705, partial [Candidatus Aenigmatarchaeota archaeon]
MLKNVRTLLLAIILTFLFINISPAMATNFHQVVQVNGSAYLKTVYDDGSTQMQQIVESDGNMYINMSIDTGQEELIELQEYVNGLGGYVKSMSGKWSSDAEGASLSDVAEALQDAADYRTGETNDISTIDEAILQSISRISYSEAMNILNKDINPTLNSFNNQIKDNMYSIEAISDTLEVIAPEKFCEMKRKVLKKYGLGTVKCGLHSKKCYNGDIYTYENGRDYCIHTDMDVGCYEKGGCGHIKELKIQDTEVDSYLPVHVKFWNNNNKITVEPRIDVNLYKPMEEEVSKKGSGFIGKVRPNERKSATIFINTSNMTAGSYEAEIIVSSGKKEIYDRLKFNLYSHGEIPREGIMNFVDFKDKPEYNETLKIIGNFQNTKNISISHRMMGKIYWN